jgi:HEPN domain-containing protein
MTDPPGLGAPEEWLRYARADLAVCRVAMERTDILPEIACFHAQQCAEKSLKALLLAKNIPFPRTHIIEFLLDLLAEAGVAVPAEVDEALALTQYAVQMRYPGVWEPVTRDEARAAAALAAQVLAWTEEEMGRGSA